MSQTDLFKTHSGFCQDCGSILPLLTAQGDVTCYTCNRSYPISVFQNIKVQYTINFNSVEACEKNILDDKKRKQGKKDKDDGPIVERKCPKCGNDKMSYATIQLRSADEGQTVFFTCTKCKYKESENS